MVTRPGITKMLCVGGPCNGQVLEVAAVESLPLRLTLPYWPADDPESSPGQPAYYVPTKLVMFGRGLWVLIHDQIDRDWQMRDLLLAQELLTPAAFKAWESGVEVTRDGH